MKIALFGHGSMGRLIESRAHAEGHEVPLILTSRDAGGNSKELEAQLHGLDVAIDFSVAEAVTAHVAICARQHIPLVIGTTGWLDQEKDVRRLIENHDGALVYGANFSIGVNLFYRVVACATELFAAFETYAPFIEEAHHARKKDAPSGTAIKLRDIVSIHYKRDIPVSSTRAGYIPGRHRVGFDSMSDQVSLTHTARSREGFAAGALAAARWIQGRRGVFEVGEIIDEILAERLKHS